MKFKEVVGRALARRNVQIALATGLASVSSLSMAADGSFDTGESLAWIGAGVAAALLITGAMFGLVTLVGAAKKAQRAGT